MDIVEEILKFAEMCFEKDYFLYALIIMILIAVIFFIKGF